MHRCAVLFLACSMAFVSLGADRNFPNADGSWDLASDAAWSGATFPQSTSDRATLVAAEGTYHFSKSTNIYGIGFWVKNGVHEIDQTEYQSVVITAGNSVVIGDANRPGQVATLRGGTYDLVTTGNIGPASGWSSGGRNTMTIDGVVVTNANTVWTGNHTSDNTLVITNRSKVYAKYLRPFYQNSNSGNLFKLCGGSMLVESATCDIATGTGDHSNTMLIAGEGTVYTNTGASLALLFGVSGYDNVIRVEDGAKMYFGSGAYICNGASGHGNRLEIDGASAYFKSHIYYPRYVSGCSNVISVANGGLLELYGNMLTTGTNNVVVVSNATIRATSASASDGSLYVGGYDGAVGNKIRVAGPNASFEPKVMPYLFSRGTGHVFELDDHAVLDRGETLYLSAYATTNELRILNGARLGVNNFMLRSYLSSTAYLNGNTVFVGSGAEMSISGFAQVFCADNRIVVSNGTLSVAVGLSLGAKMDASNEAEKTSGNALVLQGERPKVTIGDALTLANASRVDIDLPTEPYSASWPLVTAKSVSASATTSISLSGADEFLAANEGKSNVTVLSSSSSFGTALDSAIDAANATLPKGLSLVKSEDSTAIVLRVRPATGLLMLIL